MVQDIIVYIILGLTALHIIRKSIQFLNPIPQKAVQVAPVVPVQIVP